MAPWTQPKVHLFLKLFWRHRKTGKSAPKAPKKKKNSGSKLTKNAFGEKLIFAIPSMRKPRIRMPKTRKLDTEINKKSFCNQARKKAKFWASWIQKATIYRFQNHPKIDENPAPDHFVSILLLSWSSKVVPRCQNGPPGCSRSVKMLAQNIKMETPNPQMATSRSQERVRAHVVVSQ